MQESIQKKILDKFQRWWHSLVVMSLFFTLYCSSCNNQQETKQKREEKEYRNNSNNNIKDIINTINNMRVSDRNFLWNQIVNIYQDSAFQEFYKKELIAFEKDRGFIYNLTIELKNPSIIKKFFLEKEWIFIWRGAEDEAGIMKWTICPVTKTKKMKLENNEEVTAYYVSGISETPQGGETSLGWDYVIVSDDEEDILSQEIILENELGNANFIKEYIRYIKPNETFEIWWWLVNIGNFNEFFSDKKSIQQEMRAMISNPDIQDCEIKRLLYFVALLQGIWELHWRINTYTLTTLAFMGEFERWPKETSPRQMLMEESGFPEIYYRYREEVNFWGDSEVAREELEKTIDNIFADKTKRIKLCTAIYDYYEKQRKLFQQQINKRREENIRAHKGE